MKKIPPVICMLPMFLFFCSTNLQAQKKVDSLRRISWIEGNWQGMDGNNPFYEIYKFKNDSTLEITSYNWNGKDSSGTSKSVITRHNNSYYLGDSLNYRVITISDSSILMFPNYKANNAILWKKVDGDTWHAFLETRQARKTYVMKRIYHFRKK
ncbi:MAG TPA: hypothetical protein VFZ47_09945 [Chitinophagaceae bacterium]